MAASLATRRCLRRPLEAKQRKSRELGGEAADYGLRAGRQSPRPTALPHPSNAPNTGRPFAYYCISMRKFALVRMNDAVEDISVTGERTGRGRVVPTPADRWCNSSDFCPKNFALSGVA